MVQSVLALCGDREAGPAARLVPSIEMVGQCARSADRHPLQAGGAFPASRCLRLCGVGFLRPDSSLSSRQLDLAVGADPTSDVEALDRLPLFAPAAELHDRLAHSAYFSVDARLHRSG